MPLLGVLPQNLRGVGVRFAFRSVGHFGSLSGLSRFIERPAEMTLAQEVRLDPYREVVGAR
jgi:hypothetical protein